MKLLFLFLLFPCWLHAQRFVVKDVTLCRCLAPTFTLYLGNLDGTVIVTVNITDKTAPAMRDTLFYDGQSWRWGKKFLHLYGKPQFEVLPKAQMKAYNKDNTQWLESLDTNKVKVYHVDSTKPIGGGAALIDFYHNFSDDARREEMRKEMEQQLEDLIKADLKRLGVNILFKKQ